MSSVQNLAVSLSVRTAATHRLAQSCFAGRMGTRAGPGQWHDAVGMAKVLAQE